MFLHAQTAVLKIRDGKIFVEELLEQNSDTNRHAKMKTRFADTIVNAQKKINDVLLSFLFSLYFFSIYMFYK